MNLNFQGKVAFVTGAGSGIGRAAALAFAREGASVIATDLSQVSARETAHMIEARGGRGLGFRCDVTQTSEVHATLDGAFREFGRLDFAFNNAGSEQPVMATADITEQTWTRIVDVDLNGVFLCMKHETPLLLRSGGGVIVNTASGAAVKGFAGQAAYAAAKHGAIGLTKSAALDYA